MVAIAGGLASELGGGSFKTGAVTSAMQHLFNSENKRDLIIIEEDGLMLPASESYSGFNIMREGAQATFKHFGLSNVPSSEMIGKAGILLADDMLAAAYPGSRAVVANKFFTPYHQLPR